MQHQNRPQENETSQALLGTTNTPYGIRGIGVSPMQLGVVLRNDSQCLNAAGAGVSIQQPVLLEKEVIDPSTQWRQFDLFLLPDSKEKEIEAIKSQYAVIISGNSDKRTFSFIENKKLLTKTLLLPAKPELWNKIDLLPRDAEGKVEINLENEAFLGLIIRNALNSLYKKNQNETVIQQQQNEYIQSQIREVVAKIDSCPPHTLQLTPIFLSDMSYELLVATYKNADGKIDVMITDTMMGEGNLKANSNLDLRKEFSKDENITYNHNQERIANTYQDQRVISCTGIMISLIFNVVDQACDAGAVNREKTLQILTKPTDKIELEPAIQRANTAIETHNKKLQPAADTSVDHSDHLSPPSRKI